MKSEKETGIIIKEKWLNTFDILNDTDLGNVFRGIMHRAFRGEVYATADEKLNVVYSLVCNEILVEREKYVTRCETNRRIRENYKKKRESKMISISADGDKDTE